MGCVVFGSLAGMSIEAQNARDVDDDEPIRRRRRSKKARGVIICTTGCPGVGKSEARLKLSEIFRERTPNVYDMSIDQMRYGLFPELKGNRDQMARDFTPAELNLTYNGLCLFFDQFLRVNPDMVLIADGVFRTETQREQLRDVARKHGVPFILLRVQTKLSVLGPRLQQRLSTWKGSGLENHLGVREIYEEPEGDGVRYLDNDGDFDALEDNLRQIVSELLD